MKILSLRRAMFIISAVGLTASLAGASTAAAEGSQNGGAAVSALGKPGTLHQVATVKFPAPYVNPKSFDISWVDSQTQT